MKKILLYCGISFFAFVLSIPLLAQMVVPTTPGSAGSGTFNPSSIVGLYCALTGCTIDPGPLVINGELEVNNALISACGGAGPCTSGPAYIDRVGINTSTPSVLLDVNGSANIGSLFAQFDAVNNTIGVNTSPGTDSTIPLKIGGGATFSSTPTACTAANAGSIKSNGGELNWCDGDQWWDVLKPTTGLPTPITGLFEVNGADLDCGGGFGSCNDGDQIRAMQGTLGGGSVNCPVTWSGAPAPPPPSNIIYRSPCTTGNNRFDCLEFRNNVAPGTNTQRQTWLDCASNIPADQTYTVCAVGAAFEGFGNFNMKGGVMVNPNGVNGPPPAGVDGQGGFIVLDSDSEGPTISLMGGQEAAPNAGPYLIGDTAGPLLSGLKVMCYAVNRNGGPPAIAEFEPRVNGWRGLGGSIDREGTGVIVDDTDDVQIGGSDNGSYSQPYFNGYFAGFWYFRDQFTPAQLDQTMLHFMGKFRQFQ